MDSQCAFGTSREIPEDENGHLRRCVAVLYLSAAVLTEVDALFANQTFSDPRNLYRISKAFSKVRLLPDALLKMTRLARSTNVTSLPKAVDIWRKRFAVMCIKGFSTWRG